MKFSEIDLFQEPRIISLAGRALPLKEGPRYLLRILRKTEGSSPEEESEQAVPEVELVNLLGCIDVLASEDLQGAGYQLGKGSILRRSADLQRPKALCSRTTTRRDDWL